MLEQLAQPHVFILYWSLAIAFIVFSIGVVGFLIRKNMLIIMMCTEMMLNAANLAFITFSKLNQSLDGHAMVLFSITIAAAEAAIGLGILILIFKKSRNIFAPEHQRLKG
jgi:NADH-quinone oxidoreductase subunit K